MQLYLRIIYKERNLKKMKIKNKIKKNITDINYIFNYV